MPTVEVHILCRDEEAMLPWTLAHYTPFASRVVVHDAWSVDRSRDIARWFGAEVVDWETDGINDQLARELKDTCWRGTEHDWVMTVDADELLYSPRMPILELLYSYARANVAVVKPVGWEMCSDVFPAFQPGRQLYDLVTHGAYTPEYGKPVLFSPWRVRVMNFGAGAHDATPILENGERLSIGPTSRETDPPIYLLHMKHLGPVERVAKGYAVDQERLSDTNRHRRWGNFDDPLQHAQDKRRAIMARIESVISHL